MTFPRSSGLANNAAINPDGGITITPQGGMLVGGRSVAMFSDDGSSLVDGAGNAANLGSRCILYNPSGLNRWRAAASLAEYGVARINCRGDSLTLGTYSNDSSIPIDSVADAQGYVGRLRAKLARKLGATPAGFMPANDSRTTKVSTGAVTSSIGLLSNTVLVDNVPLLGGSLPLPAAATISFPLPACTTIEIVYMDSNTNTPAGSIGGNTGTFSYSVDGGGSTTTTVDNVNPVNYKRITITGLANAVHTLLITGVSGTCYIAGVNYYGANGVIVSRMGLGGGTMADMVTSGPILGLLSGGAQQRIFGAMGPSAVPAVFTGAVVSGSPVVTGISSTAGIVAGMPVGASAQLPLPCFVKSVDSATQITLTANATGDNAARGMYIGAGVTQTADLWVVPIGHNDWSQQSNGTYPSSVAQFKVWLQLFIDQVAAHGGCVLFVGEPKSNIVPATTEVEPVENYWAALIAVASANTHAACIQINQSWGTFQQAVDLGYLSAPGGVHPLKKGSADMADIIASVL